MTVRIETKAILELKVKRSFAVDFIFHKDGEVFIWKSVANAYNRALDTCGITYVRNPSCSEDVCDAGKRSDGRFPRGEFEPWSLVSR